MLEANSLEKINGLLWALWFQMKMQGGQSRGNSGPVCDGGTGSWGQDMLTCTESEMSNEMPLP